VARPRVFHAPPAAFGLTVITAGIFFAGRCIAAGESSAETPPFRITHLARALAPGEVVEITVRSRHPLKALNGTVFERTYPFYSDEAPTVWHALIGIDLETKAGTYTVRLAGVRDAGAPIRSEHVLRVRSKIFPTRRLTVDEKFVNPPAEVLDRIDREAERVNNIFATVTRERIWNGSFVLPVRGDPISSFGKRTILNGEARSPHSGTDFEADTGTPVAAVNAGKVVLADNLYYSGNTIILDHGQGLFSYFAHLSQFEVKEGMTVKRGDRLGRVGATGRVTGPHLHWTVRLLRARVDPLSLLAIGEIVRKNAKNTADAEDAENLMAYLAQIRWTTASCLYSLRSLSQRCDFFAGSGGLGSR
jgi:murein DD-endopeptidase MepM/ murein hydrolase activator NlpD